MDLLNAQLELRFELIRAVTPKYSEYKYCKTPLFSNCAGDDSKVTATIKKLSRTAVKWISVDVDEVARSGGFPRAHALRKLQEWNDWGAIELKPSGIINRFKMIEKFPQGEAAKKAIIQAIYAQFEERERSDMERVQRVIKFVTTDGCLNRELASHFGDQDSIPGSGCGTCSFCTTRKPVQYSPTGTQQQKECIDESKITAILRATKVRDDARFLARIAFGVSSPRMTAEQLGKHAVFGSMANCDFEVRISNDMDKERLSSELKLTMVPGRNWWRGSRWSALNEILWGTLTIVFAHGSSITFKTLGPYPKDHVISFQGISALREFLSSPTVQRNNNTFLCIRTATLLHPSRW